jgi:hypothetical protein
LSVYELPALAQYAIGVGFVALGGFSIRSGIRARPPDRRARPAWAFVTYMRTWAIAAGIAGVFMGTVVLARLFIFYFVLN